jgi:histidinol-phosphate/aromatic aminotransferase/cobyric acid decarboxylase-like protein
MIPLDVGAWAIFVAQVGVPSAICFFVLVRVDRTMQKMTEALNRLSIIVSHCNNYRSRM